MASARGLCCIGYIFIEEDCHMKSAKGFLSLLLALVMVLSVASVSFAESAVTLT